MHLEPEDAVKVADCPNDSLPHIQKGILQETLYRNAITHAELRSERVASPEARPVQRQQGPTSATAHRRACGDGEDKNPRHCRRCEFLISAWP